MMDHLDIAQRAFDVANLPPPLRTPADALRYVTTLLSLLPASERAGYVKGPLGGENVAPLPDFGTLVRVGRVMYPDGQIYKVMGNVPNGGPQWVVEDVRPEFYVPFAVTGPPPVPVPIPDPALRAWQLEVIKQLGIINQQLAALEPRIQALEARPAPGAKPWWWPL